MPFNFLSLEKLENNTINLIAALNAHHEKTKTELPESLKTHRDFLDGLYERLDRLSKESKEDLISEYQTLMDEKKIELKNLNKKIDFAQKDLDKKKIRAKKAYQSNQFEQIKPAVQQLFEAQQNLLDLQKLQKKLTAEHDSVLRRYSQIMYIRHDPKPIKEARQSRVLTDDQKVIIATGAFLAIEIERNEELKQINESYAYRLNPFAKPKTPDILLAGIRAAIGVTEDNPLDPLSEKIAIAAYSQFKSMNDLNIKLPEDVQDDKINSLVSAKHKLKHVTPPTERYYYGKDKYDSFSPILLLPTSKLNPTPDMSDKVKAEMQKQINEHTPLGEIGRYFRDNSSLSSYSSLQRIVSAYSSVNPREDDVVKYTNTRETIHGRDALPEEHMPYNMTDKHYKQVKIKDKQPVTVLDSWKGGYKEEDVAKVKASWKGVADTESPEVTKDRIWMEKRHQTYNFFNEKIKSEIGKFNKDLRYPKKLKAVPEDAKNLVSKGLKR